ncbi:hypothetical protein CAOG_05025 [Capsaspora owczarzaki ATCC 30864]|uniref:Fibronectin type-III domain-containing protein n=1 Tax=Capsaspora owczarzaki (strain ATCC 30864) TaxID=595528 RepID=A0A0D2X3I7_CAPO3|nr:hypothetical protein CAOG_05025 [Capsaspora owczarzaki ATCC 30864]KJE94379.1 hypothetical protein CAOG_005025 [Capsaspora owczarzaki ATCC 30864]|eukprot:XP_004346710.1 hypothetical protein CAOG_05025 [Capsaspora owczarzaki ATCC 30864]
MPAAVMPSSRRAAAAAAAAVGVVAAAVVLQVLLLHPSLAAADAPECARLAGMTDYVISEPEDFELIRGCDVFHGALHIGALLGDDEHIDEDIHNVDALESLVYVEGLAITDCGLWNLDGLRNLRRIAGDLVIAFMPDLVNIDGLYQLTEITGSTSIIDCNELLNLDGLVNVLRFGGPLTVTENDKLLNVDGIWENTHIVEGYITLSDNEKLCGIDPAKWSQRFHGGDTIVQYDANATWCEAHPRIPPAAPDHPVVIGTYARAITVNFTKSDHTNGLITMYRFFLYDVEHDTEYPGENFTDPSPLFLYHIYNISTQVRPNTEYMLRISVTTMYGETSAPRNNFTIRTLEDVPEQLPKPHALTTRLQQVDVLWSKPTLPNGEIILYQMYIAAPPRVVYQKIYEGQGHTEADEQKDHDFSKILSGLLSDTDYNITVFACTAIGCTSNFVTFTSLMEVPQAIAPISATEISTDTVRLNWHSCFAANDRIGFTAFHVILNGQVVLYERNTEATEHVISDLAPGQENVLVVEAQNRAGWGRSSPLSFTVPPRAPEGMARPVVLPDDTFVNVTWTWPARPNGRLLYVLVFLQGRVEPVCNETLVSHSCIVSGLIPKHQYYFSVRIVNEAGSADSAVTAVFTERGGFLQTGISTTVVVGAVLGTLGGMVLLVVGLIAYKRHQHAKLKRKYHEDAKAQRAKRGKRKSRRALSQQEEREDDEVFGDVDPQPRGPAEASGSNEGAADSANPETLAAAAATALSDPPSQLGRRAHKSKRRSRKEDKLTLVESEMTEFGDSNV